MILIEEANSRRNVFYKYFIDNKSNKETKTLIKTVEITCETSMVKKNEYYIIYDSNMNPIKDAFRFINYNFLTSSPNTQLQAISSLRILYSFLELFDLDINDLTDDDINHLKYFLRGYSPSGNIISINLNTNRSNSTINTYLAMFRRYTSFLNLEDCNLHKISPISNKTFIYGSDIEVNTYSYVHNERTNKDTTVPRYISVPQYKKILEVIDRDYTIREECIVRLMFEAGLRIGEVLGLTKEDIQYKEFTHSDTDEILKTGVVYLRDRITDKKYQLAKGFAKPSTRRDYITRTYKANTTRAYISVNLYDLICEYVKFFHNSDNYKNNNEVSEYSFLDVILYGEDNKGIKKKNDKSLKLFKTNYEKYTLTDIVDKKSNTAKDGFPILENNFYIFINNLGKPLNVISWNEVLREIFDKCEISLDSDKREHNLNHRFRHGYAMYLVRELKLPLNEVQRHLRHKSSKSVEKYFRPTDDDIATSQNDFSKSLEDSLISVFIEGSLD